MSRSHEGALDQPPLRSRVLKAGTWVTGGYVLRQMLRLVSNLIMTRLLVPEMFGVMALAQTVLMGVGLFSDLGIKQSIIFHRRGEDSDFLNTAWTLQILRGVVLWLIVLLFALILLWLNRGQELSIHSAYSDPALPYVLAALSFTALIEGFESTKLATANRQLIMGRITSVELIGQLAGLLLMIGWALVDRSIWALVAGALFGRSIFTLLSHLVFPGQTNRWHWDMDAIGELFGFGKWIFLGTMFTYIGGEGLKLLQGGMVSSEVLGFISIAGVFAWSGGELVSTIAGSVAFPAFSDASRGGAGELTRTVRAFQAKMVMAVIPVFFVLSLISHQLIAFLYDERYRVVGHFLGIMAINGAVGVLPMLYQNAYLAEGNSRKQFLFMSISMVARVTGMTLGFYVYGVDGLLYGIGVGTLLLYTYVISHIRRRGWFVWRADIPSVIVILLFYWYLILRS